jgi:hypothetical protein
MTAVGKDAMEDVRELAHEAKHNDALAALTRVGFLGFGVTHLVVAWIAVQIAVGRAPAEGDQTGAFQLVREGPFGKVLLGVVAVGLAAMAAWQALEAAVGHRDVRDGERVRERVMSAGRTAAYAFFAVAATKVLFSPGTSGADEKEKAANSLMDSGPGRLLVGAIGVGLVALSVGLAWYGLTRHFERHLRTWEMSAPTRRTMRWLGQVGYVTKAVAYGIVGVLVVTAAVKYDPEASRGLDAALREVADQPWGTGLLLVVALGLAAYGLFVLAQARYRKV